MASELARFVVRNAPLFVVTGAGCSTASGIADYRDSEGQWKRSPPIQFGDFLASETMRKRYWARSMAGWPTFSSAQPNAVHRDLVALERAGYLAGVVTQNVDGLHESAGQRALVELHGNLSQVICLACGHKSDRDTMQAWLWEHNPRHHHHHHHHHHQRPAARLAADGDADVEFDNLDEFVVPSCRSCGGTVKPDVVFYGESVPKAKVADCFEWLGQSKGILVLGSSLMVFSSFRFCRRAAEIGLELAVVNRGVTRADNLATLKVDALLEPVVRSLCHDVGVHVGR